MVVNLQETDALVFPQKSNGFSRRKDTTTSYARIGKDITKFMDRDGMHRKGCIESIFGRGEFTRYSAAVIMTMSFSAQTPPTLAASIPPIGVPAPIFELPNNRGGITTLASLASANKGQTWTVLYFFPGAFTNGCTLEARGFQRDLPSYRQLHAQIVGVSVDPLEKNVQFCKEEKLDFDLLSDAGGRVSKLYGSALSGPGFGTFSNRQTYIIDPDGNLRWVFTDVESHVARHSREVLEKLNELVLDK